jgi:hypothetical protein
LGGDLPVFIYRAERFVLFDNYIAVLIFGWAFRTSALFVYLCHLKFLLYKEIRYSYRSIVTLGYEGVHFLCYAVRFHI